MNQFKKNFEILNRFYEGLNARGGHNLAEAILKNMKKLVDNCSFDANRIKYIKCFLKSLKNFYEGLKLRGGHNWASAILRRPKRTSRWRPTRFSSFVITKNWKFEFEKKIILTHFSYFLIIFFLFFQTSMTPIIY